MTLEECYLSILKNSNSWNPTKSHTVGFDWEKMKLKDNHVLNSFFVHIMLFNRKRKIASTCSKSFNKKYGLCELIQDGTEDKRYSLQKDSLLFFLGLMDTLEPLKALKYDVKVLDVVDLEVRQVDEKIHMIFKENNGDTYIENLQKRAQGLVDWLKVQVNDFNNGFEIIILQ